MYFSCNPAKTSATAINVQMTRRMSRMRPITGIKILPSYFAFARTIVAFIVEIRAVIYLSLSYHIISYQ